jgi:GNAT superfamily N-acetyltransferase
MAKCPHMSEYLADSMSYYTDLPPESSLVAIAQGQVAGALLGAVDTARYQGIYKHRIRPLLIRRCLRNAHGWPGWFPALLRTEWAGRRTHYPPIDLKAYPAHLHIGVLPAWRRQGIGTALMQAHADVLRRRAVPGYHLYASSFHPLGVAVYRKLGLEVLGDFRWRLHTGEAWLPITEVVFGLRLQGGPCAG